MRPIRPKPLIAIRMGMIIHLNSLLLILIGRTRSSFFQKSLIFAKKNNASNAACKALFLEILMEKLRAALHRVNCKTQIRGKNALLNYFAA